MGGDRGKGKGVHFCFKFDWLRMSRSCRGVRSISHFQRPLPLCCLPISPARSRHLSSFFRRLETGWRSSFESFGGDATGPTTTTSPPSSTTTSSCSPHSSSAYNLFPGSSAFIPYSSSLSSSSLLPIAPAPLPALLLDRKCPSSSSSGPQPLSIFDLFDKVKKSD